MHPGLRSCSSAPSTLIPLVTSPNLKALSIICMLMTPKFVPLVQTFLQNFTHMSSYPLNISLSLFACLINVWYLQSLRENTSCLLFSPKPVPPPRTFTISIGSNTILQIVQAKVLDFFKSYMQSVMKWRLYIKIYQATFSSPSLLLLLKIHHHL